jgi:CelD/BcsL family acetyltransferase involved in cellulose biosynthesis
VHSRIGRNEPLVSLRLAFDYCLEYNKTHYALKTGYDPAYQRFSPGKVLRYLMLVRAFSEGLAAYELLGVADPWKSLHMFAPTALGFLNRTAYVGTQSASKHARSLARSSIVGERSRLLKRGHAMVHARLRR